MGGGGGYGIVICENILLIFVVAGVWNHLFYLKMWWAICNPQERGRGYAPGRGPTWLPQELKRSLLCNSKNIRRSTCLSFPHSNSLAKVTIVTGPAVFDINTKPTNKVKVQARLSLGGHIPSLASKPRANIYE